MPAKAAVAGQGALKPRVYGRRLQFGKPGGEAAAVLQHLDESLRCRRRQRFAEFPPDPLGGKLAKRLRHARHERPGLRVNAESLQLGGETGDAEHPQRVFGEGVGDMAQAASAQVLLAAEGVDQTPLIVLGHGVDAEVPAGQVRLQADVGSGFGGEPAVPRRGLALRSGQRVLLLGFGMEKHREITPNLTVAQLLQGRRTAAHHHPVPLLDLPAKQFVAHRAADQIDLHQPSPPSAGTLIRSPLSRHSAVSRRPQTQPVSRAMMLSTPV